MLIGTNSLFFTLTIDVVEGQTTSKITCTELSETIPFVQPNGQIGESINTSVNCKNEFNSFVVLCSDGRATGTTYYGSYPSYQIICNQSVSRNSDLFLKLTGKSVEDFCFQYNGDYTFNQRGRLNDESCMITVYKPELFGPSPGGGYGGIHPAQRISLQPLTNDNDKIFVDVMICGLSATSPGCGQSSSTTSNIPPFPGLINSDMFQINKQPKVCPDSNTINLITLNPIQIPVNAKKFWSVSYGQLPLQFKGIQTNSDDSCSFQSNTGSLPVYVQIPGVYGTTPVQIGTSTTSATLTFKNANDNTVSNIPTCALLGGTNNNCFITSRPDSSTIDTDAVVRWDMPGFDIEIGGQSSGIHINTEPKSYWLDLKDLGFDTSTQLSVGDIDTIENFIHVTLIGQLSGLTDLAIIQDPPSNNVLVTDNNGKKTGKDSDDTVYEEIPGSLYIHTDEISGVVIPNPSIGEKYNTKITGTTIGPFTISPSILDLKKSTTKNTEFVDSFVDDNINKIGQIKSFDITFIHNENGQFEIPKVIKTNNPPVCTGAEPSQSVLWPPNHKMYPININNVIDPDNNPIRIKITSVFQDEPVSISNKRQTNVDGDKAPDASGIGTDVAEIRSERLGDNDGRVYHISFTADDGTQTDNGQCNGQVTVSVPNRIDKNAVDSGPLYDSTTVEFKKTIDSNTKDRDSNDIPSLKENSDNTKKDVPFKLSSNF